jgi:hypothetical protein
MTSQTLNNSSNVNAVKSTPSSSSSSSLSFPPPKIGSNNENTTVYKPYRLTKFEQILNTEQVNEIANEPNYEAALAVL